MPNPRKPARLWLKKRKDGSPATWIIIDAGKQISTGCIAHEIERAEQAHQTYLAASYRVDTQQRSLSQISCADVMMFYLDSLPPKSTSTATRRYHLKALEPFWGGKTLAQIKGATCRAYVKERPVKQSTARLELKTLQTAINYWHKENTLPAVPQVTLPSATPPRDRALSRKEVAKLLMACRKVRNNNRVEAYHITRVIRLGLVTCTRGAATLALRWQPSTSGGWIDVDAGIMFRRGWRQRETSKRRPPIALPAKVLAMCARWKRMDDAEGIGSVIHYQGQPIQKLRRSWTAVVKEAGLGSDVVPHTLKHTGVTLMILDGVKVLDVSILSGTDVATLERVYAHYFAAVAERKSA